jgi:hypothetical protein
MSDESTEDQSDFQIICQGLNRGCEKTYAELADEDFKGCEWCIKLYWDQFGNKTEVGPGNA